MCMPFRYLYLHMFFEFSHNNKYRVDIGNIFTVHMDGWMLRKENKKQEEERGNEKLAGGEVGVRSVA